MRTGVRTIVAAAVVMAALTGCSSQETAASKPAAKASLGASAGESYAGRAVTANRLGSGDYVGSDLRTPQVHRIETAALPQE